MRKFRDWRSMRQTRSKTRKQREASAMAAQRAQPAAPDESAVLSIFLNDFTDSDNEAAALVWASLLDKHTNVRGIYIAEPRHVNLGYYMTSAEFSQCIKLVAKLQPPLESGDLPLTTVLSGRMTKKIIESRQVDGRSLNDEEHRLLERCIRPEIGDHEDSIQHAHLLAMDYLSTMRTRCKRSFDCYVDNACLNHLESPINLKTHWHEELVFRTAEELDQFQNISQMPISNQDEIEARRGKLREWYKKAVERKAEELGGTSPFENLKDYDTLFKEMRKHDRVVFFGGCSLTILQHILLEEPALAQKVEYYQQGGTFNSSLNILGNPFNFALNTKAAEFVFDENRTGKLAKFVLVPTDTTKKLEFTIKGLKEWSNAVGLHSLEFVCRMDPWDLISSEERGGPPATTVDLVTWRSHSVDDPKYADPTVKGHKGVMADLVAFLISFTDAFDEYKTPLGPVVKYEEGVVMSMIKVGNNVQMVLNKGNDSPIRALMLRMPEMPKGQDSVLIQHTKALVEGSTHYPETRKISDSTYYNSLSAGGRQNRTGLELGDFAHQNAKSPPLQPATTQ